jgi:hypothetical protein
MDTKSDLLMLLLLDPCLTADEAAREAAARVHTASVVTEARTRPSAMRRRPSSQRAPADTDGPAVGF